jgi:hypothetical protein
MQEVEDQYREVYAAEGRAPPSFPATYPTSVLLGCVDVVDCLKVLPYCSSNQSQTWFDLNRKENARLVRALLEVYGFPYCWRVVGG